MNTRAFTVVADSTFKEVDYVNNWWRLRAVGDAPFELFNIRRRDLVYPRTFTHSGDLPYHDANFETSLKVYKSEFLLSVF